MLQNEMLKSHITHVGDLEEDFPPTLFILSRQDPISQKAKNYVKYMKSAGLEVIKYEKAGHCFMESNNPEGIREDSVDMLDVINSEQESLAREAEGAISKCMRLKQVAKLYFF